MMLLFNDSVIQIPGWHALPAGTALGTAAPLDAYGGNEGQSLSDPKNHPLRTLL